SEVAGVHTLRERQSSLMPLERKLISPKRGSCMARGPNWSALRIPDQFVTGCGGFHRSSPTGGAAKGIPLKLRSPESGSEVPSMMPLVVMTRLSVKRLPRCLSFMETTPLDGFVDFERWKFEWQAESACRSTDVSCKKTLELEPLAKPINPL